MTKYVFIKLTEKEAKYLLSALKETIDLIHKVIKSQEENHLESHIEILNSIKNKLSSAKPIEMDDKLFNYKHPGG